ncbi:S16 family serine protease [Margalitia sp. FSL K6-0131]|uniref:S16 family serine protease n=1 Tax=Margalitia sp. FSL K6-0131 TaxID=2954604 RepID=UPI0030F95662
MNKSSFIIGVLTIIYYLLFLLLYLQDVFNEFVFVCILFLSLIILLIYLIVLRKQSVNKRKIAIATFIIFLLFLYEFPLALIYNPPTYLANIYKQPSEVLEGSGIFLVGVSQLNLTEKSKRDVIEILSKQQADVLSVEEVDNKMIYSSKNSQILKLLHLQKDPIKQMGENVTQYLGKEEELVNSFTKQSDTSGSSAGLGLALSGRLKNGDYQNSLPIAVTGAINENGEVLSIGYMKEKIQIVEKSVIPYMIIPSENAEQAAAIQKELKAKVEIFDVSNVDEAVQLIQHLNDIH